MTYSKTIIGTALLGVVVGAVAPQPGLAERGTAVVGNTIKMQNRLMVQALEPEVVLNQSGPGDMTCSTRFRVEANVGTVRMHVSATDLYFDKDPQGLKVPPIPLDEAEGVRIEPEGESQSATGTNVARFVGPDDPLGGLPSKKSEELAFTCTGEFCFTRDVLVTVAWVQDDPNKPAGSYRGKVKLTCILGEESF